MTGTELPTPEARGWLNYAESAGVAEGALTYSRISGYTRGAFQSTPGPRAPREIPHGIFSVTFSIFIANLSVTEWTVITWLMVLLPGSASVSRVHRVRAVRTRQFILQHLRRQPGRARSTSAKFTRPCPSVSSSSQTSLYIFDTNNREFVGVAAELPPVPNLGRNRTGVGSIAQ